MLTAISMVRDERPILPVTVANLLEQGVDVVLVADHGSTDGTTEWLAEASATDPRVQWTRVTEPGFHQADIMTVLARVAAAAGASWVLPVDADELWVAAEDTSTLAEVLESEQTAAALETLMEDFPAPVDIDRFTAADLTRFRWRFAAPAGQLADGDLPELTAGMHAFLSHTKRPKWMARASPDLVVGPGAHDVFGLGDAATARTDAVRVLHAPLRDRQELRSQRGHGQRLRDTGFGAHHGWQQQMLLALDHADDAAWERLWRANTIGGDGRLPSGRACDEVVADDALAVRAERLVHARVRAPRTAPPRLLREFGLDLARQLMWAEREAREKLAAAQDRLAADEREQARLAEELAIARAAATSYAAWGEFSRDRGDAALADLRSTWSWRLTRPLRGIARVARPPADGAVDDTAWARDLVDPDWYLSTYPDVAESGQDPVQHYARWGLSQGRLPRPPGS